MILFKIKPLTPVVAESCDSAKVFYGRFGLYINDGGLTYHVYDIKDDVFRSCYHVKVLTEEQLFNHLKG